MDWQIRSPASANPSETSELPVVDFFTERLKTTDVVLFPQKFELSGDPNKVLGEEAEKKVIDHVSKCKIPGIKIICFHHLRVIGRKPSILREVDLCCFISYQGRYYILMLEVKCNANIRKSNATRKKAIAQLRAFPNTAEIECNVLTDKVQTHVVWPFMEPVEPCERCERQHPSLYERPAACQQPGTQRRTNPEPWGLHLFKDKFDGDEFSKWLHSIVENTSKAVDQYVFDSVLQFVTHQSVGVLYDETVKSFCILGKDQEMLVQMNERPLDQPTVIYGLAGTGKTIAIMARIQHVLSKLTETSKAIYLTSEENAIRLVKRQLEVCNIDLVSFPNPLAPGSGLANKTPVHSPI